MRIVKPKALKPGDVIGVCSPASPPASSDLIHRGLRYLESLGYRIELGRHTFDRRGYLAGNDRNRVHDLHTLFRNRHVKAIIATRGGYGLYRILPLLDFALIRRHPKIVVGYSDLTALQLALFAKCGLVTFSGSMVAGEMARGLTGEAEELFWRSVTSTKPLDVIAKDLKVWRNGPVRSGRILGGNLALLSGLCGSSFLPSFKQSILLLEEIGERPYRIDRMMQQLKLTGLLEQLHGLLLGQFVDCEPEEGKPSLTLRQIVDDTFTSRHHSIHTNLRHGHIRHSLTIPIGVKAVLEGKTRGKLRILESAVQ